MKRKYWFVISGYDYDVCYFKMHGEIGFGTGGVIGFNYVLFVETEILVNREMSVFVLWKTGGFYVKCMVETI